MSKCLDSRNVSSEQYAGNVTKVTACVRCVRCVTCVRCALFVKSVSMDSAVFEGRLSTDIAVFIQRLYKFMFQNFWYNLRGSSTDCIVFG